MEYAPEGTLRDRHPKGERIALSTVVSYVDQLAPALQYAHDHRVIHRDIKPENILVRADGTLLVSDFGIAKLLEQSVLMSLQAPVGTPVYMAPEQHRGYPCFASDQYSLAVVVYEWICGTRPFQGSREWLTVQHMTAQPPSLRSHLPTLPEAVERVVLKALAKAPEDRFERIQAFADALREAVQPPVIAPPSDPTQIIAPRAVEPLVMLAPTQVAQLASQRTISLPPSESSLHSETVFSGARHGLTRRVALAGLVCVGSVLLAGTVGFALSHRHQQLTYRGHSDGVKAISWSPDGTRIASSSHDHTVHIWLASDGTHLYTYQGHSAEVVAVAWSPDGSRIASASHDHTVQVWRASDGTHLHTYQGHSSGVWVVAWSPDSTRIASAGEDHTVQVWQPT